MSSAKIQLALWLFTALIAVESLLVSVFGNLYTVYARYWTADGAPICDTIRRMSYILSVVIMLAGILALYSLWNLYCNVYELTFYIALALALIVALIPIPAVVISWKLYKDKAPPKLKIPNNDD